MSMLSECIEGMVLTYVYLLLVLSVFGTPDKPVTGTFRNNLEME